jgi:hypothetical protein
MKTQRKYKEQLQKILVSIGCIGRETSEGCWLTTEDVKQKLTEVFPDRKSLLDWAEDHLGEIKEIIQQYKEMKRMGWQQIETAPKDGTKVLLISTDGTIGVGKYVSQRPYGYWEKVTCLGCPTYWRPLPEAPEDDETE